MMMMTTLCGSTKTQKRKMSGRCPFFPDGSLLLLPTDHHTVVSRNDGSYGEMYQAKEVSMMTDQQERR